MLPTRADMESAPTTRGMGFARCNTKAKPAIISRRRCAMLGHVVLFVGIILSLAEIYFIFISIGFRKKQCKRCRGYLINTIQHKNHYSGGKCGRFYKSYLDYDYIYRVNGKEYHISGGVPGVKSNISQVVDIVYQKKNPKFAYIHRFTFPIQPIIALLLFPLCVMFVICGIFLI